MIRKGTRVQMKGLKKRFITLLLAFVMVIATTNIPLTKIQVKAASKLAKPVLDEVKYDKAHNKCRLHWKAVDGADYYIVKYNENNNGWKTIDKKFYQNATYIGVNKDCDYKFKVQACTNSGKVSEFSNVMSCSSKESANNSSSKLSAPQLKVNLNNKGKYELSWNEVDKAAQYEVWVREWKEDGTTGAWQFKGAFTTTKATLDLDTNKNWTFTVYARSNSGVTSDTSNFVNYKASKKK